MTEHTQTFTVVDPRTFDGDPYEVAERACQQAEATVRLAAKAAEWANIMARNAELSRQDEAGSGIDAEAWEDSVHGRKLANVHHELKQIEQELGRLATAAGFNPKKVR